MIEMVIVEDNGMGRNTAYAEARKTIIEQLKMPLCRPEMGSLYHECSNAKAIHSMTGLF